MHVYALFERASNMFRYVFVAIYALLIAILLICSSASLRSGKPIGRSVSFFCLSLSIPVFANMLIIGSGTRGIALVGYYIYYIGMDIAMYALLGFTREYTFVKGETKPHKRQKKTIVPIWLHILFTIDVLQLILNNWFGHAFELQEVEAYGKPYFFTVTHLGVSVHRIVCYSAIAVVIFVFVTRTIKVPLLYKERYIVILFTVILGTIWQAYYVYHQIPIDRSMFGFTILGLMIYYFSILYRPLRLLDRMLADIVSDTKAVVVLYGPEGRCIWANGHAGELTGITSDNYEEISNTLTTLFGDIRSYPEGKETEVILGISPNERCYMVAHGRFSDRFNRNLGTYVRARDITSEKERIKKDLYAANHDALTGLYNKEYTFKVIGDRLKQQSLRDYYVASIYICDFKVFNDVFGREFGDAALRQIAVWVRKYADDTCVYGRIAGDTFGSCLPKRLFDQEVLEKELAHFKVRMGDTEQQLVIHIGFCEIEDDDQDPSVLFDRALVALDSIRHDYRKHVAFFDKKIREKMIWDQEISAQLDGAIEENQIRPYLQPRADKTGKIVGAEALVRWIHPVHGFMSPGDFIPLFEDNGMITELDKHIWKSTCEILANWEKTHPDLFISVNVSPKDFYMTDVLAEIVSDVMEYDIDPHNLRIEVTESSMMRDTDDKMKILEEFRKQGFIVEMDDFGSGYSSLNLLKDMPVDILKIDMKFLGKSNDEEKADIIVKNVIRLSEDLRIISLAEGVETVEQFERLKELGCHLFQGYYFSKPLPVQEFEAMLDNK
ncbi:MAG: EAL domain-containing protein [Oscillospiraceae bacterium]|nr:EAL domain-containing protein [Oscillospiraceae bacterium]